MKAISKTVDELLADGGSPLPLQIIADYMGISLVGIDRLTWTEQDDGHLANLTIVFKPDPCEVQPQADDALVALRDKLALRHKEALHRDLDALDRYIAIAGIPRCAAVYICDNCGCIDPDVIDDGPCSRVTVCCLGRGCGWGKTTSYKIHELADMEACIDHIRSRRGKDFPPDLPVVMTGARVPRPEKTDEQKDA